MRSPQPLLVPLLVLPLRRAEYILLANTAVRRRILTTTERGRQKLTR